MLTEMSRPAARTVARIVWEIGVETDNMHASGVLHVPSTGPINWWTFCEQENFEVGAAQSLPVFNGLCTENPISSLLLL